MNVKNTRNPINYTLNCNGKLIIVDKPLVMGIINVTPDSFYANSRLQTVKEVVAKAQQMVADGASIIDIGAQSTRPNSTYLTWQEEWSRLAAMIEAIKKDVNEVLISIDTFHSQVAINAVQAGAAMVNDISAGSMDDAMLATVAQLSVPYIAMHIQGTPQTMQLNPTYTNVVQEVLDYGIAKKLACEAAGIKDVIFDVGFGFGKTIEHNYTLLNSLDLFTKIINAPLIVGLSRKSMITKVLHCTADESLNGATALHTIALQKGASILRVHDVKEAVEVITLLKKLDDVDSATSINT